MTDKPKYDPSIQALLELAQQDWNKVEENRKSLVPYGFEWFDRALYGINTLDGELIIVQGPEKGRKTTTVLNIIANIQEMHTQGINPPTIVVDTLESGMPPERYRDALVSLMATRALGELGHSYNGGHCKVCRGECKEIGFAPEFLRFNHKTETQLKALDIATNRMKYWNLRIYGAKKTQGNTRNLEKAVARWEWEMEKHDAKIFVTDHIQQYDMPTAGDAYHKLETVVNALGKFVAEYGAALFAISQVSLSSWKEARDGVGEMIATGGAKAAQEANVVFNTEYNEKDSDVSIKIVRGRRSGKLGVEVYCDPSSGAFVPGSERLIDG